MNSVSNADAVDPLQFVIEGVHAKEAGLIFEAESLFLRALKLCPEHPTANFELAVLLSISGRHFDALEYFRKAYNTDPHDPRIVREFAKSAAFLGYNRLMDETLNSLDSTRENVELASFLSQFSTYIDSFPLETTVSWLRSLRQAHEYLQPEQIIERILLAILVKQPFSFVRLGDGEGSHLKLSVTDESRFNALYSYNRKYFRDIWFQNKYAYPDDLDQIYNDVIKAAYNADILGVPYESWLRHEFNIASPNGICSLTNIVRILMKPEMPLETAFCDQNIHFAIAKTSFFERLFAMDATFHIISCHTDLPKRVEQVFGNTNVILHKIPSEGAYKHLIGDEADNRLHFPDVFREIRRELQSHIWSGHVFIVSAGYLGKVYCADIKNAGGVAIDLGSVADGIMGKATRPGMGENLFSKSS